MASRTRGCDDQRRLQGVVPPTSAHVRRQLEASSKADEKEEVIPNQVRARHPSP